MENSSLFTSKSGRFWFLPLAQRSPNCRRLLNEKSVPGMNRAYHSAGEPAIFIYDLPQSLHCLVMSAQKSRHRACGWQNMEAATWCTLWGRSGAKITVNSVPEGEEFSQVLDQAQQRGFGTCCSSTWRRGNKQALGDGGILHYKLSLGFDYLNQSKRKMPILRLEKEWLKPQCLAIRQGMGTVKKEHMPWLYVSCRRR